MCGVLCNKYMKRARLICGHTTYCFCWLRLTFVLVAQSGKLPILFWRWSSSDGLWHLYQMSLSVWPRTDTIMLSNQYTVHRTHLVSTSLPFIGNRVWEVYWLFQPRFKPWSYHRWPCTCQRTLYSFSTSYSDQVLFSDPHTSGFFHSSLLQFLVTLSAFPTLTVPWGPGHLPSSPAFFLVFSKEKSLGCCDF